MSVTSLEVNALATRSAAPVIPLHLLLATAAKVLASAVFITGRDVRQALRDSAFHAIDLHGLKHVHLLGNALRELVMIDVDQASRTVTLTLKLDPATVAIIVAAYRAAYPDFSADWAAEAERLRAIGVVSRRARQFGDQGCAILRQHDDSVDFAPVPVRSNLADAASLPWPDGDVATLPAKSKLDRAAVGHAVDAAFEDASAHTAAVVVLHKGEIVGERYREGISRDTLLEGWSMGKSVTATLLAVLVEQGLLSIDDPAPIPPWRVPGDPRGAITVRHLLQMRSGLTFSGTDETRAAWRYGVSDHLYLYSEAIDVFDFVTSQPLEHPPGAVGRYRNCDPLALGCIVKSLVAEKLGQDPLQWPQAALFDRVGIRRFLLETDLHGNFISCGFDYSTARNWARLGLLYLRRGMWQGKRVLPEWWADFVSTPAPSWSSGCYGGQFWLNRAGDYRLPDDAYYMAGIGEQRVFIVPSQDLVVVRLGHRAGDDTARDAINAMLGRLAPLL
jgi:CubicO group peptidase (beta-lactamase class C family)